MPILHGADEAVGAMRTWTRNDNVTTNGTRGLSIVNCLDTEDVGFAFTVRREVAQFIVDALNEKEARDAESVLDASGRQSTVRD